MRFLIAAALGLVLVSCQIDGHFKEYVEIEDGIWNVKNEPTFNFEIADATKSYNVYYLVRHAVQYPYYNLYVKRILTNEKKKVVSEALNELVLMDEKTGKPLGNGLGDLFDHKVVTLKNYRFPEKGKYTLKIRQYMRQNELPGILSMGVSIEEVK